MPDIIRGGYQPPGTRTRQTDTGTGGYTPPQNNYAQQQQSAQEAARRRAQQEAARRAELDRLARQNAQQIAAARRQAYQQQMQALQQQQAAQQRAQYQAQQQEEMAAREAKDAQAYDQYYSPEMGFWDRAKAISEKDRAEGNLGPLPAIYTGIFGPRSSGYPGMDWARPQQDLENKSEWGVYDPYGLYGERYGGSFTPYGEGWYKPDLNMFNWNDGRKNEFMEEIWPEPNYAVPETAGYPSSGGYGDYQMPNYGGYGYPSINYNYPEYEEPAKNWYENMLQWNIK
jgi:hypothetical protein